MDTRLRKFKYSLFTKFLCWLIAICAFACCFSVALKVFLGCIVMGPENYFKDTKISFFETKGFLNAYQIDLNACAYISSNNATALEKSLSAQKESITSNALKTFLDYKAGIIESELRYAVENWDESYYDYDGTLEVTIPEEYATKVYVNIDDPESIQLAQKILVNAKGQEFLIYEDLVRSGAFEASHSINKDIYVSYDGSEHHYDFHIDIPLEYNEEQATKFISEEYDSFVSESVEESSFFYETLRGLESKENLKYYVVDFDGDVYSNIDSIPQNLKNYERYVLANGKNHEVKGFELSNSYIENNEVNVVCMYYDEDFKADDVYGRMYNIYKTAQSDDVLTTFILFVAYLLVAVAMLVIWLSLVGKKANTSQTRLLFIDKIPTDLHLAATVGLGCGLYVCLHDLLGFGSIYFDENIYARDFRIILVSAGVVYLLLLTEWLASVVRIKKAGESFFKRTLIFMLLHKIFEGIVFVARKFKKLFEYKPKIFKVQVALGIVGYFLVNCFAVMFTCFAEWFTGFDGVFIFLVGLCLVIFNIFIAFFVIKYINNLDKIIVASGEREKVQFTDKKVSKSLVTLADNLDNYNDALNEAVAEAVKNEQMKTQLITNVSHDLKTPLTSLINYSDLLQKCEIEDETANEYIGVINNQSIKLKRLIEDLIEASKVSTGNVQLNKVNLNFSELTVQAIVEFTPEFDNNRLEIRFTEPDKAPVIFADSTKAYRIISNLFSNAKKYSAPGTRVYVSIFEDEENGYFEIKNISKEPLNISPQVLTERFVRGDSSRANDGNGLGLSIAQDLCRLHGGELDISIDGDLFKVTVKMPKA